VTSLRVGGHSDHQTSCVFFTWGCVGDNPVSDAMFSVAYGTRDAVHKARDELDCRLDVCHVTHGSRFRCVCEMGAKLGRPSVLTNIGLKC